MSPAQLLGHFDRISEAPGAVARLRRFVLDLAVRGKLVEQDPNDEPVAELLRRIEEEETRFADQGSVRNLRALKPIGEGEIPFPLPAGWELVRMGRLALKLGAGSTPLGGKSVYQNQGVPFLRSQNVYDNRLRLDDVALIPRAVHERMSGTHVQPRDILLNITGASIGRCALVPIDFVEGNVSQHVAIVRLLLPAIREFIHLSLVSPFFQDMIDLVQVGVSREGLSMERLRLFPMFLPPLAEQQRIVAKVDELMALCDRLEAAQAERERRRDRLVAASLERLTEAIGPNELRQAARFHLQHLPRFTTRASHFDRLRGAVLDLAVTGRLTSRQPSDGDAASLLTTLARSKKSIRKASEDAEGRIPLPDLPGTWTWAVLDDLAAAEPNAITDGPFGANLKTAHYVQTPGYRVIRLQNVGHGDFRDEHRAFIDREHFERLAKHHIGPGDLVVAGLVDPLVRCCEVPHSIGPAVVKADCYRYKVHPNVSSRFVLHYLNSPICQRFASAHHHGMTLVRIGLGNFRRIPIPVPPLAEQLRIVATVDALLAVCDKLETQLSNVESESTRLLEATLHQALSAA